MTEIEPLEAVIPSTIASSPSPSMTALAPIIEAYVDEAYSNTPQLIAGNNNRNKPTHLQFKARTQVQQQPPASPCQLNRPASLSNRPLAVFPPIPPSYFSNRKTMKAGAMLILILVCCVILYTACMFIYRHSFNRAPTCKELFVFIQQFTNQCDTVEYL